MKGIVFNEFIEMVEDVFGAKMADDIIDESPLASGGAYTSVGTYDHTELVTLVVALSNKVNIPVPTLVHAFGKRLAGVFAKKFPSFFADCDNSFSFLKLIDNHIHVEVRKLYPDAELPRFSFDDSTPNKLDLIYESTRQFSDLAHGLIEGCAAHYGDNLQITRSDQSTPEQNRIVFSIQKLAP